MTPPSAMSRLVACKWQEKYHWINSIKIRPCGISVRRKSAPGSHLQFITGWCATIQLHSLCSRFLHHLFGNIQRNQNMPDSLFRLPYQKATLSQCIARSFGAAENRNASSSFYRWHEAIPPSSDEVEQGSPAAAQRVPGFSAQWNAPARSKHMYKRCSKASKALPCKGSSCRATPPHACPMESGCPVPPPRETIIGKYVRFSSTSRSFKKT